MCENPGKFATLSYEQVCHTWTILIRPAGVLMNTPKIQTVKASRTNREEDHSIYFPESNFQIPPSLQEMFSYFVTVQPTAEEMMEAKDIYILKGSRMNPHCDACETNEENMLDWKGNMVQGKDRVQVILS